VEVGGLGLFDILSEYLSAGTENRQNNFLRTVGLRTKIRTEDLTNTRR